MIITDGEKTMTLRELAVRICNSFDDKDCDQCPANEHCHNGHNGMLDWLKQIVNE